MDIEKLDYEPGYMLNITANITDQAIEFEERCMGEALRRWQIHKEDVLERVRKSDRLRAENEKLRAELNDLKDKWDKYQPREHWETLNELCESLHDELEQVKRDRDSIEQDFRAFTKQWWEQDSGFPCRWCKSENSGGCEWKAKHPGEICAGRAFEWRGQKEG